MNTVQYVIATICVFLVLPALVEYAAAVIVMKIIVPLCSRRGTEERGERFSGRELDCIAREAGL